MIHEGRAWLNWGLVLVMCYIELIVVLTIVSPRDHHLNGFMLWCVYVVVVCSYFSSHIQRFGCIISTINIEWFRSIWSVSLTFYNYFLLTYRKLERVRLVWCVSITCLRLFPEVIWNISECLLEIMYIWVKWPGLQNRLFSTQVVHAHMVPTA
jgi:hypothetical protein